MSPTWCSTGCRPDRNPGQELSGVRTANNYPQGFRRADAACAAIGVAAHADQVRHDRRPHRRHRRPVQRGGEPAGGLRHPLPLGGGLADGLDQRRHDVVGVGHRPETGVVDPDAIATVVQHRGRRRISPAMCGGARPPPGPPPGLVTGSPQPSPSVVVKLHVQPHCKSRIASSERLRSG